MVAIWPHMEIEEEHGLKQPKIVFKALEQRGSRIFFTSRILSKYRLVYYASYLGCGA